MELAEQGLGEVNSLVQNADALVQNVAGVVVAKREVIEYSVVSVLAGGHLLLNDLPGVGKTLLARSLARSLGGSFKRIQFTPDLLPTDITGSSMMQQAGGAFQFVPGPIFANVVLADEINRASTRTQSALLESMAEGQVTADGLSYALPTPFWVVATQNEVDSYGTFPLPHAQLDRFIMTLSLGYPDAADQTSILEMNQTGDPEAGPVLSGETLVAMQAEVREMAVSRAIREYMAHILVATREHELLRLGASPRGGVHLQRAAQALAALRGANFVAPEHIREIAPLVLGHRVIVAPGSSLSPEDAVAEVVRAVPVPL
jgi:MoxR-like ATPase